MRTNLRLVKDTGLSSKSPYPYGGQDISIATTTDGWPQPTDDWLGYPPHCPALVLRELLGCNVIVFDAVILQCRACTHARPLLRASLYRAHARREISCDNRPVFSLSFSFSPSFSLSFLISDPRGSRALSRGGLGFFCFSDITPRCTTAFHRRARQLRSPSWSHVLSITLTRNTSRCSEPHLVLTFSLRYHLPRAVSLVSLSLFFSASTKEKIAIDDLSEIAERSKSPSRLFI